MNERSGFPERIIPDETASGIAALHLKRYDFARNLLHVRRILDVACGVGYGTHYLAETTAHVVGVDLSSEALEYAIKRYPAANVWYAQADAKYLPFPDASFDAVCSFETIEHVPDVESYLAEVRRVLSPGGIFAVSTPAAHITTQHPENPHHVQEWTPPDFDQLLHHYFQNVQLYSQVRRTTPMASFIKRLDVFKLRTKVPLALTRQVAASTGVHTMGDVPMTDIQIVSGMRRTASEIIAFCD